MKHNEFNNEEKYKLYRNIHDLLHPSISKKNISNYKIIFDDKLLPLRVFYPKKVTNMKNIMIFIHGEADITGCDKSYSSISSIFSKEFDNLVISIDYDNMNNLSISELGKKIYRTLKKIYLELINIDIPRENITLVGDSTSATMILNLTKKMNKDNIIFTKYLLFYPPVTGMYKDNNLESSYDLKLFPRLKKFYKGVRKDYFPMNYNIDYPDTLILCGNIDPLIDELREFSSKNNNVTLKEICFASHGFLNSKDDEIILDYQTCIKNFLKKSNIN